MLSDVLLVKCVLYEVSIYVLQSVQKMFFRATKTIHTSSVMSYCKFHDTNDLYHILSNMISIITACWNSIQDLEHV